jgi:uncharacterized iron-regulated membrane protein
MKSKTIKKLYTLHSWVGVITGILLFIIAFTGAVSVFGREELAVWANPETRALEQPNALKIEQLINHYAKEVPEHFKEEVMIFLPRARGAKTLSIVFEAHHGNPENPKLSEEKLSDNSDALAKEKDHSSPLGILYEFHPVTYELIQKKQGTIDDIFSTRKTDMSNFIVDFHADLHLGRPVGLLTTGILGLTLLLSIATGIFIHRKILGQLFTFRPKKNLSLLLNDGHKAIGVWGILFNTTIAFTGAFLGLIIVLLVPAAAFVSFGGDQEKLIEAFTAVPEPVIQYIQQPTKIDKAISHALQLSDELKISGITIKGYDDTSAMIYIGISAGKSVSNQTAIYQGNSGEFISRYSNFGRLEGFSGAILDVLAPLHFGNFGGILVKLIWAILGLGTALLPLTGLMLWMERSINAVNPKYSISTYQRFNRLIVGGCGGIIVATFGLFPSQIFIKHFTDVANIGSVIGWPFFCSWILVIFWAFIAKCEKETAKHIAYLCGAILIAIMPMNIIFTGSHLFNVYENHHFISVGIDVIALILGFYTIKITKQLSNLKENQARLNIIQLKEAI